MVAPNPNEICDLEKLRHVTDRVVKLWGTADFGDYVHELVFDSRDGARQGLPTAVAADLMLLAEINKDVRAMLLAERTRLPLDWAYKRIDEQDRAKHHGDALDNPLVSRDTIIERTSSRTPDENWTPKIAERRSVPRPAAKPATDLRAHHGPLDIFLHLITNKYLVALVVLAFLAKTFWPTLSPLFGG